MLNSLSISGFRPLILNKEGDMPEHMKKLPGGNWYIEKRHTKVPGGWIRFSAGTSDRRLAERMLAEAVYLAERGEFGVWKTRFSECVEKYLEQELPKKSKSSQERYRSIVKNHLVPAFGDKTLMDLTKFNPKTGVSLITDFLKNKIELPESSVKKIRRVLKDIVLLGDTNFEMSFHEKTLQYSNKGFYQRKFLSREQLSLVVSFIDERFQTCVLLMAYTGLDLSEAVNITWDKVFFGKKMIILPREKTDYHGESVNRRMPICDELMPLLQFKSKVRNLRSHRIFDFAPHNVQRAWKKAVQKSEISGFKRLSVKDLRHFYGSYLLNNGVDSLIAAELMGHSNPKMLQTRYGHFDDATLQRAVSVFDETVSHNRRIENN
jgi:integrase